MPNADSSDPPALVKLDGICLIKRYNGRHMSRVRSND